MPVKMIKCGCQGNLGNTRGAAYQDAVYGENMRVCSVVTGSEKTYRCSVCGKEHKQGDDKR